MDENILFIERILTANNYQEKYADFDSFYEDEIANSFVVVEGSTKPYWNKPASPKRVDQLRAYLQPKYWPVAS